MSVIEASPCGSECGGIEIQGSIDGPDEKVNLK
jgi:hypothetical protein